MFKFNSRRASNVFACVNVDISTTYSAEERIAKNMHVMLNFLQLNWHVWFLQRTHNQCTGRCPMFLWWIVVPKLSFNSTIYGLSDDSAHNLQCHKSAVSWCVTTAISVCTWLLLMYLQLLLTPFSEYYLPLFILMS